MDLVIIDIAFRGAVVGLFFVFVPLVWMGRISREAQLAFTLLAVATSARIWSNMPPGIDMAETPQHVLRYIGAFGPFAITWFMLTIFLDDKRLFWVWLVSGALITLGTMLAPFYRDFVPFLRVYAVLHFLALLALTVFSARGDLSDARRRVRPIISVFLMVFCIGQSLTSTQMVGPATTGFALTQIATFFALLTLFTLWALRADVDRWPGKIVSLPANEPNRAEVFNAQTVLIDRIRDAMAGGIWRNEGLTVGALAQEVNAPEHRVRKAINQVLGYRNFASFINQARIDAAKKRLRAREDVETTVLEIAYDVGFSSLGPFNRAFRDATGQSPSEYRTL